MKSFVYCYATILSFLLSSSQGGLAPSSPKSQTNSRKDEAKDNTYDIKDTNMEDVDRTLDSPVCEDDLTYTFPTSNGRVIRSCSWIVENPNKTASRQEVYCPRTENGQLVRDACPKSCGYDCKKKPNVLLILADDLGTGDVPAYYNSPDTLSMPNLDSLVKKGVTFKDVHSTPLCAPTRYMLLSGMYAHRGRSPRGSWNFRAKGNHFIGEQKCIAQVLRDGANYHTFMTGKWHLGSKVPPNGLFNYSHALSNPAHNWSQPLIDGPQEIGFNSSYITTGGIQAPPYSFFRDGFLSTNQSDIVFWNEDSEHDMPWGRSLIGKNGGEGCIDWDSTAYNMILVNETATFIDKHLETRPNDPFFAYVALGGVHIPHSPPNFYMDGTMVNGTHPSRHMDMLFELDLVIGSLVSAIEDRQLIEDTIIIFTSDNGGLPISESFSHFSSGPLRGSKGMIHEGGHRVPMIWRYDGTFPENESRNHLIGLNDVYATLCELAGVSIPYASALDSVSFAPYIASATETEGLRQYLETWAYNSQGIAFQQAARYNDLKLVHRTDTNAIELFNLTSDISETTDLSQSANYAGTMNTMYQKLLAVSPCPDDVLGTFSLSRTSEIVDCSWFTTEQNIRCSENIEGELFCNSVCGRYENECNNVLFVNGKWPDQLKPSTIPSWSPSDVPSISSEPSSLRPSLPPSNAPSASANPSDTPSTLPSNSPSSSSSPSASPSMSSFPSGQPSTQPSYKPSVRPNMVPSTQPSSFPSYKPSVRPSPVPSASPSAKRTAKKVKNAR